MRTTSRPADRTLLVGVSVRALAESAVRSGYPIVALDAFGDRDLLSLCSDSTGNAAYSTRDFGREYSAEALADAAQRLAYGATVYTANLENFPALVGGFGGRLLGNPPEALAAVRDWPRLYAALVQAGFRVPESHYRLNGHRPDPACSWLLKPLLGGGGLQIRPWRPGEALPDGFLLQEHLPGPAYSAQFLADGQNACLIGLTEQLTGRPEFGAWGWHYCGNLLPVDGHAFGPGVLEQAQQIAALLARTFRLVGANGFDYLLVAGEVCLLEVNPRPTAAMELVELAYGLPVFDLHVRSLDGGLPGFDLARAAGAPGGDVRSGGVWADAGACMRHRPYWYGKAIVFAKREVLAAGTETWPAELLAAAGRACTRHDIPHTGERLARGKPICTLIASATTRAALLDSLATGAKSVQGELHDA